MILTAFLLKFIDCALSTIKNVFLIKERYLLSSVCNSLAAVMFIFVADVMANTATEDKWLIAIAIFIANLTGSYLPPKLLNKLESNHLHIYSVTSDTLDNGIKFADELRQCNVPISTNIAFNNRKEQVLYIQAYSRNKTQSSLISAHIRQYKDFNFHVIRLEQER